MTDARPYRPSNGEEGEVFMEAWCARCRRDAAHRRDESKAGCTIIARSMAYDVGDPKYPKDWVQDEKGPRCTRFEAETPRTRRATVKRHRRVPGQQEIDLSARG